MLAPARHRQEVDEVGQPDVRRSLQLRILVQEVVDFPGLVPDPDVVLLVADDVVKDHEVRAEDLVHSVDRLERVQVVLAGFELTPQELQIALLLADGTTTREAAAAVFLSPKTIEYHLRNVYRKLGIRSREELAATFKS